MRQNAFFIIIYSALICKLPPFAKLTLHRENMSCAGKKCQIFPVFYLFKFASERRLELSSANFTGRFYIFLSASLCKNYLSIINIEKVVAHARNCHASSSEASLAPRCHGAVCVIGRNSVVLHGNKLKLTAHAHNILGRLSTKFGKDIFRRYDGTR